MVSEAKRKGKCRGPFPFREVDSKSPEITGLRCGGRVSWPQTWNWQRSPGTTWARLRKPLQCTNSKNVEYAPSLELVRKA